MRHHLSPSLQLRSSIRDWVDIDSWANPFSATLTLKQVAGTDNGFLARRVWGDELTASQNFHHFLNKLNRRLFGKAAQRYGKGVRVLPVLEGGNGKRLHYHAVIDCPRPDLHDLFPIIVATIWRDTQWGYSQIEVNPGADQGWLNYITKLRDKPDFGSSIDWVNARLS